MEDDVTMKVSEPAVAYTPTTFDTVIRYLHSNHLPIDTKRAIYRQLQSEVADENLANMKRRLKEFSKLEAGWDGYGEAIPIVSDTVKLMESFLKSCRPSDLEDWSLFPNVNGTLLLEQDDAAISVASSQYSYYAEKDDKVISAEGKETTVDNLLDTIHTINVFMQR